MQNIYEETTKEYLELCKKQSVQPKNYVRPVFSDERPFMLVLEATIESSTLATIFNELCQYSFESKDFSGVDRRLEIYQLVYYKSNLAPFIIESNLAPFIIESILPNSVTVKIDDKTFKFSLQDSSITLSTDDGKEILESSNIQTIRPTYKGKSSTLTTLENLVLMQKDIIEMLKCQRELETFKNHKEKKHYKRRKKRR